jgi:hypothetical protein
LFLIIISGLFAVTSLSVCTAWFHNILLLLLLLLLFCLLKDVTIRNDKACFAVYKVLCQYLTVKIFIGRHCTACSHLYSFNKLGYLPRIIWRSLSTTVRSCLKYLETLLFACCKIVLSFIKAGVWSSISIHYNHVRPRYYCLTKYEHSALHNV